jgi:hypothetical protein
LAAFLLSALPVVAGFLVVHLIWSERTWRALVLQLFLGAGLGLGLQSLLYFAFLLAFAGRTWFVFFEVAATAFLLAVVIRRDGGRGPRRALSQPVERVGPVSGILVGAALVVAAISLLSTADYLLRRRQGDWDAWMMYNRAARFIHMDQTHWLQSFSPEMDPLFHADYPLLLAMNITAGWDALKTEANAVPMLQSALFAVGCAGLLASALAQSKSIGQASLGIIILWGVPTFLSEGARQMADVPLAFFILATGVTMAYALREDKPHLLILAGFAAGLGAWTKNEGSLLVIGALVALLAASARTGTRTRLALLVCGLALPVAVLLYFKLFIAPPGDMLTGGAARLSERLLDASRHAQILAYFAGQLVTFGAWEWMPLAIGIIPILVAYLLLFRGGLTHPERSGLLAAITIVAVQLLGDYAAFLMTPYPLEWHLSYSTVRLIVQVFPLLVFAVLSASLPVERLLARPASA